MRKGSYSFRLAHETKAFAQFQLVDDRKFVSLAKERGIQLGLGSTGASSLERLDELGGLKPIAFGSGGPWREPLVFRDETEFVPWATYAVDDDGFRRATALFSPWQLLYLKRALDLGTAPASVEWLLDTTKRRRLGRGWRSWLERQAEERSGLDARWRPTILLLVRLQNRYLPSVRGTLTTRSVQTPFDPETGGYVDHDALVREFDPEQVLRGHGLTVEEVKNVHHRLVSQAAFEDPLDRWSTLIRMAPYTERQKLKGDALRAQDAYDAGAMLRDFYFHLTDELLPQPDEVFDVSDGSWRERIYGHEPRLRYTRGDLKAELQRHGPYPHLVHLVVEGDSEKLIFEFLVGAFGFEPKERGVSVSVFGGVGKTDLRAELLRSVRSYSRFPILVCDREGDIEKDVEALKQEGLLTDATTFLWNTTLEEDNFSDAELVQLAKKAARRRSATLRLTPRTLRKTFSERRERVPVGLAEVLVSLASAPGHGSIRISKPDLAREMAAHLRDEINSADDLDALASHRPIVGVLLAILRAT